MNLKEQNILFFTRTMKLGGTENVVLQLCEIFKPLVNSIVVCSCGGVNVEKLNEMGINHYLIPDIENKSISTLITVSNTVRSIVKDERITIIHTHHRMAAFYVSLLGLYKKYKFLNTSHNTFDNKKFLTRFAYRHSKLIACGEMVKKNLVEVFELDNVSVVHNSVKPFEETVLLDETIDKLHSEGCFVIGNVGRLSEQKGMKYFINAAPKVLNAHPNARFLIIGSGEDEIELKVLTHTLGLEEKVLFLGYRNDIQNLMSQLDLVVLSSLWEGFPLTPIEAFSVGKTIVATAVDGTVEIIKDGINGFLIEAKSSEQIANKVNWMIEHPDKKKEMEKNASASYKEEFSMSVFAEGYIDCYTKS